MPVTRIRLLACLCALWCLAGCTLPAELPATAAPPRVRLPVLPPTSVATRPPPLATPDASVRWPPDVPAFLPPGATAVDVSEVDTDGDGVNELLVIYTQDGIGRGLVIRRAGAAGRAYALGGAGPSELFRERWGENTVADVNGDGRTEVVVEGVVSGAAENLSVFQWNGSAYVRLLSLAGPEGVAVDDPRQDGVLEFTALGLVFSRSAMLRGVHADWVGGAYRQSGDLQFLLGIPVQFIHPEEAALAYYQYWRQNQPDKMYALLADPQRALATLEGLAAQARSIDRLFVESLSVDEELPESATVTVVSRMILHDSGREVVATHVWRLVKLDDGWRLAALQQP